MGIGDGKGQGLDPSEHLEMILKKVLVKKVRSLERLNICGFWLIKTTFSRSPVSGPLMPPTPQDAVPMTVLYLGRFWLIEYQLLAPM